MSGSLFKSTCKITPANTPGIVDHDLSLKLTDEEAVICVDCGSSEIKFAVRDDTNEERRCKAVKLSLDETNQNTKKALEQYTQLQQPYETLKAYLYEVEGGHDVPEIDNDDNATACAKALVDWVFQELKETSAGREQIDPKKVIIRSGSIMVNKPNRVARFENLLKKCSKTTKTKRMHNWGNANAEIDEGFSKSWTPQVTHVSIWEKNFHRGVENAAADAISRLQAIKGVQQSPEGSANIIIAGGAMGRQSQYVEWFKDNQDKLNAVYSQMPTSGKNLKFNSKIYRYLQAMEHVSKTSNVQAVVLGPGGSNPTVLLLVENDSSDRQVDYYDFSDVAIDNDKCANRPKEGENIYNRKTADKQLPVSSDPVTLDKDGYPLHFPESLWNKLCAHGSAAPATPLGGGGRDARSLAHWQQSILDAEWQTGRRDVFSRRSFNAELRLAWARRSGAAST